jgi:hypothetical protein
MCLCEYGNVRQRGKEHTPERNMAMDELSRAARLESFGIATLNRENTVKNLRNHEVFSSLLISSVYQRTQLPRDQHVFVRAKVQGDSIQVIFGLNSSLRTDFGL